MFFCVLENSFYLMRDYGDPCWKEIIVQALLLKNRCMQKQHLHTSPSRVWWNTVSENGVDPYL